MKLEIKDLEKVKADYIYSYQRADDDPEESGICQGIEAIFDNAGKNHIIQQWRDLADKGVYF